MVGRHVRDQKGGAFGEGKTGGKSDDLFRRHHGLLGIAAGLHADDDLLANRESVDVRRRFGDNSCRLLTGHEYLPSITNRSGKLTPDALTSTRTISGARGLCGSCESWRRSGGPSSLQTTAR
jgi:hypothetical protein